MDAQPILTRVHTLCHHKSLVMVLRPIVVNAFCWFDQKPNQIEHNRADKIENRLIYKIAGNNAGIVVNHSTDHILHAGDERHNSPFEGTKKTHNNYSTTRLEKYKCLDCLIVNTFPLKLQTHENQPFDTVSYDGVL